LYKDSLVIPETFATCVMQAQRQALSGALNDSANQLRYSCSLPGRPEAIGEQQLLQVVQKMSISVNSGYVS